jgi:hypothetical protein
VNVEAALGAVEDEVLGFAFEIGLHRENSKGSIFARVTSASDRPCPTAIASSTRSSALAACSVTA